MQTPEHNVRTARRLQRSIVVYFVVGLLLSGLSISALTLWFSFGHLKEIHDRGLSSIADARRAAVEEYVTRLAGVAAQIASRTKARERLQAHNRGEVSAAELAAFSAPILEDGRRRAADALAVVRRAQVGQPVVKVGAAIADDVLSVAPGHSPAIKAVHLGDTHALLVVAPILDRQGVSVGSDAVVFSLDALQSLVEVPIEIGAHSTMTLGRLDVDGTAEQIAHTHSRDEDHSAVWDGAVLTAITRASSGTAGRIVTAGRGMDGAVVAYAPIRNTDWGLAVRVTRNELYAPMWRELGVIAMWLALLLVIGAVATVMVTRPLSGKVLVQTRQWLDQLTANEQTGQALRRRTDTQQTILETVNQGIAMVDGSLRIIAVNRRYRELMDVPVELLQPGGSLIDVIRYNAQRGEHGAGDVETIVRERTAMWQRAEHSQFERTRPNGTMLQVELQPVLGGGSVMTYTDVTEREAAVAAMRNVDARYRALYDDNPAMFFTVDTQGQIVSANRFGAEQLGYTAEELIGEPLSNLRVDFDVAHEQEYIQECLTAPGTVHRREVRKRHRDGRTIWVRESARAVANAAGDEVILLVCEDVTQMRKLSEELVHHAAHDTLTGLVNRREFESRLDDALESATRDGCEHALCYLDLDQFKVVNDTCGHTAGDEMLRQIAKLLLKAVRGSDTLARLGGDEFGLLVTRCPLSSAEYIANTVRALIEDFLFVWEDKSFRIGVSIGVVPITRRSESRAALMSGADAACYAAKDGGRNRVHVFHVGDAEVVRRQGEMNWIGLIQGALDHDRLRLDFQPIVALSADGSEGEHYELLVRMDDAHGGIVSPGQFLPVAESYNLAPRIDRWVIARALGWLARHPAQLARLSMCSINLSGLSLTDEHFPEFVLSTFRDTGVPPAKICFEITETAAISNLTSAIRLVSQLRDAGCRFALDDFGSGLSSFGYLKHLPVEFVKIDGMFVKDILDDPIDLAMVRSINEIAHVLGKRTIAEFVESDAILEAVRQLGIDYAQGYAIGRPQSFATRSNEETTTMLLLASC